jgi:hypothetical protein
MAMIWSLFIIETEVAERYYDVEQYDTQGKPLKIQDFSIGGEEYFRLDPIYAEPGAPSPSFIGGTDGGADMDDLLNQGWVHYADF